MTYCPACGAETPAGAAFCARCGARLAGGAPPKPDTARRVAEILFLAGAILGFAFAAFFLAASSLVLGTFVPRMGALGAAFLLWPAAGIVGSILALVARARVRAGVDASTLGLVAGVLLLTLGLPGFLVLGAAITLVVTRKSE